MQYLDFKAKIAAYLARDEATFNQNGVDLVLDAVNNARRDAQKLIDFEYLRCQADVVVDLTNGGSLLSAVLHGTTTPVSINRIIGASVNYAGDMRPIDYVSRKSLQQRVKRIYDYGLPWEEWVKYNKLYIPQTPMLFREANTIYLWPQNSTTFFGTNPTTVVLDVVKWADDYQTVQNIIVSNGTSGNAGDSVGPVPLGDNTFFQIGVLDGYPAFMCLAGPIFMYFWNPDLHQGVGPNTYVISNFLYNDTFAWIGPDGATNPLGPYTATGFTPTGQVTATTTNWTGASDPDFFLTECNEWLTNAVLRKLHYYIKSDDRFVVTQKMLDDSFAAMLNWNDSIAGGHSGQEYDLS